MARIERVDRGSLDAARQKYLQLGCEIERGAGYGDLAHTHSKLGIFLSEALGPAWRGPRELDEREAAEQVDE